MVLSALVAVGCARANEGVAPGGVRAGAAGGARTHHPIEVTDSLGRRVGLTRPAQRIASLSPSSSEIVHAVGCGAKLVLRDHASDHPEALRALPATDPFRLSVEHIASFTPDLVLLSHVDGARLAGIQVVGLQVAVFDPPDVPGVFQDILRIGTLCGRRERAALLVQELRARLGRLERRLSGLPRPAVYIELDGSDPLKPWTAGAHSFVSGVIRTAGGRNIFSDLPRSAAQVSAEAILARAPDFIVIAGQRDTRAGRALSERSVWRTIVEQSRARVVETIDPDLLTRPGPRIVEGISRLARLLHPRANVREQRDLAQAR